MSEQNPPPDMSADDTEGHRHIKREAPRARTADDLTEGRGRIRGPAEDSNDDTEGHIRREAEDADDDTEGHIRREAEDADDDTEGHFKRW